MKAKRVITAFLPCLLLLVMMVSGCMPGASISEVTAPNRAHLLKLSIGMSREEVLNIMGTEDKVAVYYPPGSGLVFRKMIKITNPYRSEILQGKNGTTLEVIYYVTDVKRDDAAITDDELTPLIFDNARLIGWGWSFLVGSGKKYEIRIR